MQNNANKYVRVSDIATFYFCSRLTYFSLRRAHTLNAAEVRAEVFKSLSASIPGVLTSSSPAQSLADSLCTACEDAMVIYGNGSSDMIEAVRTEAAGFLQDILSGLLNERQRIGEKRFIEMLSPISVSESVYSDRLRMSGTIDRIVRVDGELEPVVISMSTPPSAGIYARERIRLAAYSLLIAEKYGEPVTHGLVEYATAWQIRETAIRSDDKRKALYARNRILEMMLGKMPGSRRGEWCKRCEYDDSCTVRVSFLDNLLKK
jgi:CRISPR-associated exonuclease Cas4